MILIQMNGAGPRCVAILEGGCDGQGIVPPDEVDLQPEPNLLLGTFVRQANCTFAFGRLRPSLIGKNPRI
jgi:hypothetical protein